MLVNSYAIFSGLKFKTTSYNHEGAPFYLVITIYYGSINESQFLEENDEDSKASNEETDNTLQNVPLKLENGIF